MQRIVNAQVTEIMTNPDRKSDLNVVDKGDDYYRGALAH